MRLDNALRAMQTAVRPRHDALLEPRVLREHDQTPVELGIRDEIALECLHRRYRRFHDDIHGLHE